MDDSMQAPNGGAHRSSAEDAVLVCPTGKKQVHFVLKKAEQRVGRSKSPSPTVKIVLRSNTPAAAQSERSPRVRRISFDAVITLKMFFKEGGSFSPAGTEKANPQALPGV